MRAVLSSILPGVDDLIVILVAVVVLFGGTQLPKLARNTGEALKEFRKAHNEAVDPAAGAAGAPGAAVAPAPAAVYTGPSVAAASTPVLPAAAAPAGVGQAAGRVPGAEDVVTVSRSDLDALIAERVARAQAEAPKAGS
jgi:sec-independent protein translocase protein TatA